MFRVGAKLCCSDHIGELGPVVSKKDIAVIGVCSQFRERGFTLQYRIHDAATQPLPAPVPSPGAPQPPPNPVAPQPPPPQPVVPQPQPAPPAVPPPSLPSSTLPQCPSGARATSTCQCGNGPQIATCIVSGVCLQSSKRCAYDRASNCAKNAPLCANPTYRQLMAVQCEATCALQPNTNSAPACADRETQRCDTWRQQGFCTTHRADLMQPYCAKTCGFC